MSLSDAGGAKPFDILLLSNGPGELTTWVRPVVMELRQLLPQARLSLMLTPCPHASGQELKIAQDLLKLDRVQPADALFRFLLTGQTEEVWDWAPRGVVLFLGGDQFYAVRAGNILGYRVVIYAEQEPRWRLFAHAFAVRTEAIKQRYGSWPLMPNRWHSKMQVVGDLMVDGVTSAIQLPGLPVPGWSAVAGWPDQYLPRPVGSTTVGQPNPEESEFSGANTLPDLVSEVQPDAKLLPRSWLRLGEKGRSRYQVAILPGSKPSKLSLGVPMGLAVADELRQLLPNVNFVMPVAPSQSSQDLASYALAASNPDMALVYGTSAVLEQTNVGAQFVTPFGTVVHLWTSFPAYSVLANCDLCITTIGANTAELGRLRVPMMVLIPLNKLEAMRAWDGILGMLANLPGIGTLIAKQINRYASQRLGLLAWPNIWAGEEVVPELRGHLKPFEIAKQARNLLENAQRRYQMQQRLFNLGGQPGAAKAVAEMVMAQLEQAKSQSGR